MSTSLGLLTDEAILDFTRSDGRDHIISDHHDLNLRNTPFQILPRGLYDTDIFGSPYANRCTCGKIKQPSNEPCPACNARVFTEEQGLRRFARVELPFYYLNDMRLDIFQNFIYDTFKDCEVKMDFAEGDIKSRGYGSKKLNKLGIKVFDSCQFDYNPTTKTLTVSEFITDESKASYEGLLKIYEEHFPDKYLDFKKLINRYYLILPAMMRPFQVRKIDGEKKLNLPPLTVWYEIVVSFCCAEDKNSNSSNYDEVMSRFKNPGERVKYTALCRALLNAGKREATELLNTSKENLARGLYSVRTLNSARCPIVPDTKIAVDEVAIPTHIAYEMMREGFIAYLIEELNFSKKDAQIATRKEWDNPETQKLFKEYAEKQYVLD